MSEATITLADKSAKVKQPRTANPKKSFGCSYKSFRNTRGAMSRFSEFCGERKNQWFKFSFDIPQEWPGCYVIYIDGGICYVGQTENIKERMYAHRSSGILRGIDRDRIEVKIKVPFRYGEWAMTEYRLIKRLKPPLNVRGVANRTGGWE